MFETVRRIAPAIVLVLLTWTVVDVLNPALCGLDQLPFVAAHTSANANTSLPDAPPAPADDCFCCSHNVNFAVTVQMPVTVVVVVAETTERTRVPLWKSFPLYHPPRLG